MSKRRTHSPEFKARVAMEAITGRKTIQELAADHAIHPIPVSQWKKQLLDGASELFTRGKKTKAKEEGQAKEAERFQQIGKLEMELEWLKKNLSCSDARGLRKLVDPVRASERLVCRVVGQHRSTQRHPAKVVSIEEGKLRHRLREIAAVHIRWAPRFQETYQYSSARPRVRNTHGQIQSPWSH
jgi:transposase